MDESASQPDRDQGSANRDVALMERNPGEVSALSLAQLETAKALTSAKHESYPEGLHANSSRHADWLIPQMRRQ